MPKYIRFIALCLLAALLLLWFGWNLDWAAVYDALARSDWRLIAGATTIICACYLVRAYRWRALLAPLAPSVNMRELFAATTVGFGAVFLIGRAGEIVRPAFLPLRDRRVRPGAAFVTIAVERIYDMVAIIVLFAVNLLWFRPAGGDAAAYARVRGGGIILLVAAAVGIAGLVWFRRFAERIIRACDVLFTRFLPGPLGRAGKLINGLLEQLARALSVLVDARALFITVGWTVLLWAAITFSNWLLLRAFGLQFGLSETVFVMGWALVGSMVPTPGGAAGAFHAATAAGLIFLGVARAEAAAATIVLHLVLFGPAVFFGLYYFLRSDVSLAGLRQLAATGDKQALADKPISTQEKKGSEAYEQPAREARA